jgi:RHS repeat-associated protein
MGRLNGMTEQDINGTNTYASGGTYNAAGQLAQIDWNWIGTVESRQYNTMGQLTNITAGYMNLTYNYTAGQNNGKIASQTDWFSGETVTYAYDTLNRLISAQGGLSFNQAGTNWGQGFQYDPFGNLSAKTVLAGSAPTWSAAPDVTTNHVGGTDANGNSSAYGWDSENRLVASAAPPAASYTRYAYDGQNKQIWSCTWNTSSNLCTTDNGYSFYSPAGKLLGTFTISFTPYYYANNQLVPDSLTITNGTPLAYFGSRRLWVPDRLGSQGRFFPYGEDRTGMNYPQSGQYAFGTYLDNGSGLYYADQRWYAAAPGRFLSPDRRVAGVNVGNPQSWNLFAYVNNDPINYRDPRGMSPCKVSDDDDPDYDYANADSDGCGDDSGGGGGDGTVYDVGAVFTTEGTGVADPVPTDPSDPGYPFDPDPIIIAGNMGPGGPIRIPIPVKTNPCGFMKAHAADAQAIAIKMNVPVQYILAVFGG